MEPDISKLASLLGEPSRARIMTALMCGRALTATELALAADVMPQTASSHLQRLCEANLLIRRKQGRHRYFQLYDHEVAALVESMLTLTSRIDSHGPFTGPEDKELRYARVCYDHLAGEIGVSLYRTLVNNSWLIDHPESPMLTDSGRAFFLKTGVPEDCLRHSKRPVCKSCLDWSERNTHLSGKLGQWILLDILSKKWAVRDQDTRAVRFTQKGLHAFKQHYHFAHRPDERKQVG